MRLDPLSFLPHIGIITVSTFFIRRESSIKIHSEAGFKSPCMPREGPINTESIMKFKLDSTIFLITGLGVFCLILLSKADLHASGMEYPEENFFAPSFELPSLEGRKIKLADFRGKIIFINFWATWCIPCKTEMASMEKLYQRFKGTDFKMLAISVDKDISAIKPYLEKYNLTFPVLLDPENLVKKKYKTVGLPETYLVDKRGLILHKAIGPRDWFTKTIIEVFEQLVSD